MKLLIETLDFNSVAYSDAVVFGITNFSHDMASFLSFNDINIDYLKQDEHEKFIYLNNLIDNNLLADLNELLSLLSGSGIKVIFEDYAILMLCKQHQYQIDLYLGQVGAVTSSAIINDSDPLIKGALITPNLDFENLSLIIKKAAKEIIVFGYGHLNMYYSKRTVLTNYFDTFNIKSNHNGSQYKIQYQENDYFINQTDNYSSVRSDKIYNLVNEIAKLDQSKINYLYCSSFGIDNEVFNNDINMIKQAINNLDTTFQLTDYYSTYQLYNPNYYKVKKNE